MPICSCGKKLKIINSSHLNSKFHTINGNIKRFGFIKPSPIARNINIIFLLNREKEKESKRYS